MRCAIASVVVAGLLAAPACAFADEGDVKWPTSTVPYYNGATKYASGVKEAARLWNRSGARIRFKAVSKRKAKLRIVVAKRAPDIGTLQDHGYTKVVRRGRGATGTIYLHRNITKDVAGDHLLSDLLVTRAVAHEMGHVLGLRETSSGCSVMNVQFDVDLPFGCPRPKEAWRYRCRVLEKVDVKRAVKRRGGRARKLGEAVCDRDKAPPAPTDLTLTVNLSEQTVDIRWKNPSPRGSTHDYYLAFKRGSCPTDKELADAVSGFPPEGVGVWDPVAPGAPGSTQSVTQLALFGTFCVAVVPATVNLRAGPAAKGSFTMAVGGPTADFDYTASGLTVSFHDESTTEDGYKPSSLWTFGDGQTSEDENPQHTYASPGTYTVKLVVTDQQGLTAERTKQVAVSG
jgi:hypothetical protein